MKNKLALGPRSTSLFAASEKRRLVYLVGGFLLVSGILLSTLYQTRTGARPLPQALEDESASAEPLVAPPALDVARLRSLVRDRELADQVVLESAAADLLIDAARRYTPRHFAALEGPELDAATRAALLADPDAARGRPHLARGRIVALRPRSGARGEAQHLGRLELEDGGTAHFLVLAVPEDTTDLGGFVRVDGLFLKHYASEDELVPGTWQSGPLLVGPHAEPSYPAGGTVRALDARILAELEDADLAPAPGDEPRLVLDTPPEPFWHVMAYARDLAPDAVDWEQAPLLDQRTLDRLLEEPEAWRGRALRLPISRLQDGRVKLAGENSARMERYTLGWIGNTTWKGVIQFRSPVLRPDLSVGDLVHGRGFFLHDFAYESAERGLRVAPVLVLESLERHVPKPSQVLAGIPWIIAGIGAFLLVLFVVLARRDRRQASAFYEELTRRRRARRSGQEPSLGAGTPAP